MQVSGIKQEMISIRWSLYPNRQSEYIVLKREHQHEPTRMDLEQWLAPEHWVKLRDPVKITTLVLLYVLDWNLNLKIHFFNFQMRSEECQLLFLRPSISIRLRADNWILC
jgi:hypothetical protein